MQQKSCFTSAFIAAIDFICTVFAPVWPFCVHDAAAYQLFDGHDDSAFVLIEQPDNDGRLTLQLTTRNVRTIIDHANKINFHLNEIIVINRHSNKFHIRL